MQIQELISEKLSNVESFEDERKNNNSKKRI